jgi:anion transporter
MESAKAGSESRALNIGYADLLATVKLFSGLGRVTLAKLAARLESVPVRAGAVLFCEGDPGDAFFITAHGSFGAFVTSQSGGAQQRVNTLGPGDPFGELALLGDHPRTATIRADTDGEVLRLERARFLALLREEPSVALAVAASLGERLRMRDAPAASGARAAPTAPKPAAGTARASRRQRVTKASFGGALAILVLGLGWSVPPPPALSVQGWHALLTAIAIIPVLATDALPDAISALLLMSAWVLAGIVSPSVALSGFSSPSWVLLVSVLIIGAAIASSGLPYRLALWTVQHSRSGYGGQVSALCVAGTLLSPAVPNATARVTLVAPAIGELIEALGYAPRSRPAAGLAMATLTGCGQMVAPFLTSSTTAVLIFAVLPRTGDVELNFLTWAFYAAPANAILLLGMIAALWLAYRPRTRAEAASRPNRETVKLQRRLIGPATRSERISLVVAVALVAGFVAQPLHGLDPAWVAVFALTVLGAARVVDGSALTSVNWNFVFLFGMLASLSTVFGATGVDRWLASSVGEVLGGLAAAPALFVAALALLAFAASFVLRWQAAAPLITVMAVPVAGAAGIHPFVVGLVALMAGNVFFLPYQSTAYLALYHGTGGRLFAHAQARPAALAYALIVVVALCASVIPWRVMGLL